MTQDKDSTIAPDDVYQELEQLRARIQHMVDQEIGVAMDCWRHEEEARAEERAKNAELRALSKQVVELWEDQNLDVYSRDWEKVFSKKIEELRECL